MKYIRTAGDGEAILDDMPPVMRAMALLLEHANQRRDDRLPLPCPCGECVRHRSAVSCIASTDGKTLVVGPA